MNDYTFSPDGGYIQDFRALVQMRHNGSIHQFATFPANFQSEICRHLTHSWIFDFTVSAC